MLALHLLQSALVHVNTLLLQRILADRPDRSLTADGPARADPAVLVPRATPTAPSGCDMDNRLDLDPIPAAT